MRCVSRNCFPPDQRCTLFALDKTHFSNDLGWLGVIYSFEILLHCCIEITFLI